MMARHDLPSESLDAAIDRLARQPIGLGDHQVLAAVHRAATLLDPVPTDLTARIRFAVAVEQMWSEVAEIQRLPVATPAGVRSGDVAAETITFTMHDTTLMVVLDRARDGVVRMDGWITPGRTHEVSLRVPGDTHQVLANNGRFEFDGIMPGELVQVVVHASAGEPVLVTPAFQV